MVRNRDVRRRRVDSKFGLIPISPEGVPCYQAEEGQERSKPAPVAHWANRPPSVNYRKVMTACVSSVVIFDAELWWKGDQTHGTSDRPTTYSCWPTRKWGLLLDNQPESAVGSGRTQTGNHTARVDNR